MELIDKTEIICDTNRVKCVVQRYQVKVCTEQDSVALSVKLWRVIVNGVVVNDYLLHKPRKAQLEKYIRV